jgi:glucose-like phosphotransferase system IIB component
MDASVILQALGGKDNIKYLDSCITRLRLTLTDPAKMDERTLKLQGAVGIIKLGGGNVQVVLGTEAELIEQEIKDLLH